MSATKAPGWLEPLLQRLAASSADRVLLLLPEPHPLARTLRERMPGREFTHVHDTAGLPQERYPLAIVAGLVETLDRAHAQQLLASLRDLLALHSVLWVDLAHSPLTENDLRALGFRVHAHDGTQLLCGFDLEDYKDRPDWLDARHWAHPELWDKFRW